jgi:hypothetical protein
MSTDPLESNMLGAPDSRPNITGLLEELDVPATPASQPEGTPAAQPSTQSTPNNTGLPEEVLFWIRNKMEAEARYEENAQAARDWMQQHKADYYPTPANMNTLIRIISEGTGQPFNMDADFDPELMDKALQAAIANDLVELPPAQSLSQAQLQDRHVAAVKQAFATETAEPAPRTMRTSIMESSSEPPARTLTGQRSNDEVAADLSKMPIDAARRAMEQLMRQARTAQPSY